MKVVFALWLFPALLGLNRFFAQNNSLDSLMNSRQSASQFRDVLELISEPATISGTRFFDYHSGIKKPYLFNGEFQLALTMGGPSYFTGRKYKWVHALQFIPCTRVRLFQNDTTWMDKSKPVRTPSYYPRVYYFFSPEKLWNPLRKHRFYFGLGVAHHSNGQDGTEFVDFTDTVNLYNGSFSESLIVHGLVGGNSFLGEKRRTGEFYQKRMQRLETRKAQKNAVYVYADPVSHSNMLNWRLLYEHHPGYFANQKFQEHGVYGGNRLIAQFSWINSRTVVYHYCEEKKELAREVFKKEFFRLSLNAEYITDLSYNSGGYLHLEKIPLGLLRKRLNVSFTVYKRFLDSRFPALFGQLAYYGSDNYNIYFQQSFFQARFGLAFAFFEYKRI